MGEGRADLQRLLREEVLTRRFQSARALGMIRAEVESLCRTFPLYPEA